MIARTLRWLLPAVAAVFFALHFLHLSADFPNNSPWMDWSKYTDEGWYGDAAIRQVLSGHWYWKGDFNPAVALPVWPLLEWVVFSVAGVSAAAARALTLCVFGVTLWAAWRLLEDHAPAGGHRARLAAPIAMLMLCVSPFFYAFERMAILEPLLICETLLAMLVAAELPLSFGRPASFRRACKDWWPSVALALLLPAMVLTKTTAIFLLPAIGYMVWARADHSLRRALRMGLPPAIAGAALWMAYYALVVHPHYLADYQYLFSANAYTGIELEPLAKVILNTIEDGSWMGTVVYPLLFVVIALMLFWRPRLLRAPAVPALLLWAGGYFAFLAYHNNLQPRYYLVPALPITLLVAVGLDSFRAARGPRLTLLASAAVSIAVLGIVVPDAAQTLNFVTHPTYELRGAFEGIRSIVMADATHPHLVLSISGSDMTLMTGVPSIDDDFGTMELGDRVKAYRPGWYAAWNELDDDKMDALTPLYHVERVASFPALDDPDRNLLILYRLDPTIVTPRLRTLKLRVPKPLVTKLGQQPTTMQLEH
jgi:hypothetical protein